MLYFSICTYFVVLSGLNAFCTSFSICCCDVKKKTATKWKVVSCWTRPQLPFSIWQSKRQRVIGLFCVQSDNAIWIYWLMIGYGLLEGVIVSIPMQGCLWKALGYFRVIRFRCVVLLNSDVFCLSYYSIGCFQQKWFGSQKTRRTGNWWFSSCSRCWVQIWRD